MVTIVSRPFTSLSNNLNAVYNGLPFVLDSNMKTRPNYRYICEVYFANAKITELRHSPDISSDKKGIFDISRIIENFLGPDPRFVEAGSLGPQIFDSPKTAQRYHCVFGEEWSRLLGITNTSTFGGTVTFETNYSVDMNSIESVLIGGTSQYNGFHSVNFVGPNKIGINKPYTGAAESTAYIIQANKGTSISSTVINGISYLSFYIKRPLDNIARFAVGNKVTLGNVAGGSIQGFYTNSEWAIIDYRPNDLIISGTAYDKVIVNAPYKFVVSSGSSLQMASFENIVYKGQIDTISDRSAAMNAARQYEEEGLIASGARRDFNWSLKYKYATTPGVYSTSFMKTLSQRPILDETNQIIDVDICWGETYQLSNFGEMLNSTVADKSLKIYMRVETRSTHSSFNGGTWNISTGIASAGTSLTLTVTGDVSSSWGVGDYVNAQVGSTSYSGRVISVIVVGANTLIFTNISAVSGGLGTITGTIRVRYYDSLLQPTTNIIPCGTWNLKSLVEMNNMTCYEYSIYPVRPTGGLYYGPFGGVGPSNTASAGLGYVGSRPRVGQQWKFSIKSCCESTPPLKLAWLNKEGGFDFYKFTLRVDKRLDIERTEFKKKQNSVKSNNLYSYSPGARGRTNWNTRSVASWVANTDYLTQKELDWLLNIYESPDVYIVTEGRRKSPSDAWIEPILTPVNIRDSKVDAPNKAWRNEQTGRLYIYTIEIESAINRIVQRGGVASMSIQKSLYE